VKLIDKAKQFSLSGNLVGPEEALLQAVGLRPEMPDAYGLLGTTAFSKGDLEDCVDMLQTGRHIYYAVCTYVLN
jgi:hypothetical protein